jgi:hypothetical protein
MTTYVGNDGYVEIAGTNNIGELKAWTLNLSRELKEDSAQGDTFKTYKPGKMEISGTISVHFDPGDANGQEALQDALLNGTSVALKLYPDGQSSGDTEYDIPTAFITQLTAELPEDEIIPREFSFTGQTITVGTVV